MRFPGGIDYRRWARIVRPSPRTAFADRLDMFDEIPVLITPGDMVLAQGLVERIETTPVTTPVYIGGRVVAKVVTEYALKAPLPQIRVVYHRGEPDGWWADSPDIDGWTTAAETILDLRDRVERSVRFALSRDDVTIVHVLGGELQ
jgi:hypothetical protein